jgi:hypothetical protein
LFCGVGVDLYLLEAVFRVARRSAAHDTPSKPFPIPHPTILIATPGPHTTLFELFDERGVSSENYRREPGDDFEYGVDDVPKILR